MVASLAQSEFDQLATYVAVAEELRSEPFMSEDNNERLVNFPDSETASRYYAYFCHPAFLKSAVAPFRKLWLQSEPCEYEKVRDLVFRAYSADSRLPLYIEFFTNLYRAKLKQPPDPVWSKDSTKEIIDLWLYTQAVHAGPKEFGRRRTKGHYELKDFDLKAEKIGREKFEYLFRTGIRIVGHFYTEFLAKLVYPLFHSLIQAGMKPGFEAAAALKYNPYPDLQYNITFDDVFWHLDKESIEETFDRLLARRPYELVHNLFYGFFATRAEALAALCESETFSDLKTRHGVVVLQQAASPKDEPHRMFMGGPYEIFRNKKIRFLAVPEAAFVLAYEDFRRCFFEERKRRRKPTWRSW
jgi:hypothetical protein